MKVINGKDIAWDDNINFDIKVIDIDFYNSTNRTLFLGHTGDDKSTLVHLVIPTEHGSNNNVYMSIKSDSGVTSTVIPKYINNNEYYFSITKDFTNISSKGYVQFFVRDTNSNDELVVIAASNKIPYIIDEALEINIIEPSEEEEIGLLEQAINSIQSLMSSKANVADVYRKNEVYSKTEAGTLLSSKANKGTTLSEYGITDAYTKTEINNKLASVYKYKGSVSTYQNLPNTNLTVGDVYNVESTGANYAWTGSNWDELGGTVDLSGYQTKIDNNNKLSSDLVDDTNKINKFVTSQEKTTWNNKADKGTTLTEYGITDAYTQEEVDDMLIGKMNTRSNISNIDNCIRNGTIYRVVIGQQNGINEYATLICVQGPGFDAQQETMTQFGFTNLGRFVRRRRINGVWENGFTDLINVNT